MDFITELNILESVPDRKVPEVILITNQEMGKNDDARYTVTVKR